MRALPMDQPWASLVISGDKRIETRSRRAPSTILGERILIHANLSRYHWHKRGMYPFGELLPGDWDDLPRGALIGSVEVISTWEMTERDCEPAADVELLLGHWSPGRWAWTLNDPRPLLEPIPWKAKQGINIVPDELVPERHRPRDGFLW